MKFTPKDRQEELDKKYPLTKEDILMFTNIFYRTKFIVFLKVLPPSQYILQVPKPLLIKYGDRNEAVNDYAINKIKLYFKLLQRGFIAIWMNDYSIASKTEKTERLKKLFEKWKIKKWDPQSQASIITMWFQKNTFFSKLKTRIFWIKQYVFKRPWVKFFVNDMLDEDMELFMDNLDYGIDINMKMFDGWSFLSSILCHIESFPMKKDKWFQAEEIFNYISEQIDWKKNYPWEVTISIPLKEYMDNKNFYYEILYQLHIHEKAYLTLKEIYLLEQNIIFVVHKIHSFRKDVLNILFPIYERIRFEGWNLFLDSEILVKWKKSHNKNYQLIDLIVRWIKSYKKLELTYLELLAIFLSHKEDFPYLYNFLNKNNRFEILEAKLKTTTNEKEINMLEIEVEELLWKLFDISYFNSSLSMLSNEKFEFILKDKTTWIEFKGDL